MATASSNSRNPSSAYIPTNEKNTTIVNTPLQLKGKVQLSSSITANNVRITPTLLSKIQYLSDLTGPLSSAMSGINLSAIATNIISSVTNTIDLGSITNYFRNLFATRLQVNKIHFNTSDMPLLPADAEDNTIYCNVLGDLFYCTKNQYHLLSIDPTGLYFRWEVDNLFTDKLANYTLTTDFNNKTSQYQTINNSDTAIGLCAKLAGNNTFSGQSTVFSGANVTYTTALTNGNNSTQVCTTAYTDRQSYENTVITTNAAYASPASLFMNNTIIYTGTTNAIFTLTPPASGYIGQTFNIYSTVNFTIKVSSGYSFNTIMGKGTFLNGNNGPTIVAYTQYIFKYAGDTNSVRWVYY